MRSWLLKFCLVGLFGFAIASSAAPARWGNGHHGGFGLRHGNGIRNGFGNAGFVGIGVRGWNGYGYGYGNGYGWGGWGGWGYSPYAWGYWGGATVPGSIYTGMGYYLSGLGQYNLATARANSINTDTWIRWNEYWSSVSRAQAARYAKRMAARKARRNSAAEKRYTQLRDNPTARDISSGNALNLKIGLLMAKGHADEVAKKLAIPVAKSVIQSLNVTYGPDASTLPLGASATKLAWPQAVSSKVSEADRLALEQSLEKAHQASLSGAVTPAQIAEVQKALEPVGKVVVVGDRPASLFVARVKREIHGLSSKNLVKGVSALNQLVANKDGSTTLGNLLQTMTQNGLRIAPAETQAQAETYARLHEILKGAPTLLDISTLEKLTDAMANAQF